jgi:hypothetical protein
MPDGLLLFDKRWLSDGRLLFASFLIPRYSSGIINLVFCFS